MKAFSLCIFFSFVSFGMTAQTISQQQKNANIQSFAKLYGYVRYFHPSDEAAGIAWERFVNYGIREVENISDQNKLKSKLEDLFHPIAPSVKIFLTNQKNQFDLNLITPTNIKDYKTVTWQHLGLGTYSPLYKSIRTNRNVKVFDNLLNAFGPVSNVLNVRQYRGLKFRMKAAVKTDVASGKGQLWARVDLDNKKYGFFDNMDSRPITSNSWKDYEIAGKIDTNATVLNFGAFLNGDGKMWVDNFRVEIDSNGRWVPVKLNNASFEIGSDKTEGWSKTLKGYESKLTKDVDNIPDGNFCLLIERVQKTEMAKVLFNEMPKFSEYFKRDIGNGLSCFVPLTLMGTENNTYPIADQNKLLVLKDKLAAVATNTIDSYVALSGVVITWNVFQHFFPYKKENAYNWEQQLLPSINEALGVKSPAGYSSVLKKLTEKLNDGHVGVYDNATNYHSIQADPLFVEGKLILSRVDSSAFSAGLKIGDEIMSIDQIPAMEKFNSLKSEISGSEQWKNEIAQANLFRGAKNTPISIVVQKADEKPRTIQLNRTDYRNVTDTATIKKMTEGIYYINIGNTEMNKINQLMPQLVKAKGIICDLRGYPKGNHEFISHLLTVNDRSRWMFIPKINYPDYEKVTYIPSGWDMRPKQPHIDAKVVFITGGYSISYAESYMSFIKHYKLATIVGQPTAGANGNVNTFDVPGNYKIRFTGMRVTLQDGSQLFSKGIQPDVVVSPTIKGITDGRDEQMEKALSILEKN